MFLNTGLIDIVDTLFKRLIIVLTFNGKNLVDPPKLFLLPKILVCFLNNETLRSEAAEPSFVNQRQAHLSLRGR